MYSNIGVRRYRETDISSMSRKMVADLNAALEALENGRRVDMTRHVNHSQRIVTELRGALDHDVGGDIARNLDALYDFLFREHLMVLVDQDPARVRNCLGVLEPLLEAWRKIPPGTAETAGADPATAGAGQGPARKEGGHGGAPAPDSPSLLSVSA